MEERLKKLKKGFNKRYVLHCGDVNQLKLPLVALSIDPGSSMMGVRVERIIDEDCSECILDRVISIGGKSLGTKCESIPYTVACTLDELYDWSECSLVIIEKQVGINKDMLIIENVIAMYFTMLWSDCTDKCVISISSAVKSCFFDDRKSKKQLSLHMARRLCEKRGDYKSVSDWQNVRTVKEGSDRGDPVLQLYAFLYGIGLIPSISV